MPRKRRNARIGVPPAVRRFDDLLRDLESVRRRLRNYRILIADMTLLSDAMKRQMLVRDQDDQEPEQVDFAP